MPKSHRSDGSGQSLPSSDDSECLPPPPPKPREQTEPSREEHAPYNYGKVMPYPTPDQKELRKRVWAKPAHMSDEERKRIIASYEADFQDFKKDEEEEEVQEESGGGRRAATRRVHFLRADLEPGLSPEKKALARKQHFEKATGETVSDADWLAIWSHETTNDGMLERLRRWAAGRDSVPVAYFNAFIQKTYAATYDAVAEEDRLRAQRLAMQTNYEAQIEQNRKDFEVQCARTRDDAKAAAEVKMLTRTIEETLAQIEKESGKHDSSSKESRSAVFKEVHADAVKALADRTRAEEAVDETVTQHIPPNDRLMKERDESLRDSIDRLRGQIVDQPSNEASLGRLVDILLTSSDERQSSRKRLFDTKERLQKEAENRAENALRVQNLGFQHFIDIEQQLHDLNSYVAQLQSERRKREDEVRNLQTAVVATRISDIKLAITSIIKYRHLVAQRVRDGLSNQSDVVLAQANKLEETISSFENISLILKNMSPPLPATVASSLHAELARITSLFEGAPESIRGLASELLDQALDEERKWPERSAEADARATVELLEEENAKLRDDKKQLEIRMLSIKDTTGISAALDAQEIERQRADESQREAKRLHGQLQEARKNEKAAARDTQMRLDTMQRSIDRAHAPIKVLEDRLVQVEEERQTAQLRAQIAEDKITDLMANLEEVSDDFMKAIHARPEPTAEQQRCSQEDHVGQIEGLTARVKSLQEEMKVKEARSSIFAQRELENEIRVKAAAIERVQKELAEFKESFEVRMTSQLETRVAEIWSEFDGARTKDEPSPSEDVPTGETELQAELWASQRREGNLEEMKRTLERSLESLNIFNTKLLSSNCELRKLLSEHDQAYARLQLARVDDLVTDADFRDKLVELQEEVVKISSRKKGDPEQLETQITWGRGKRQSIVRIQQAFAGTPSADHTKDGLMSSSQIEAYWKYLLFQRQRSQAVNAMRRQDWQAALSRLEALDEWFEGAGDWHRFYKESEIQGSVAYVRAFCLIRRFNSMPNKRTGDQEGLRGVAKRELERAGKIAEGEDSGSSDDESDAEKRYTQVWQRLGERALEEIHASDGKGEKVGEKSEEGEKGLEEERLDSDGE